MNPCKKIVRFTINRNSGAANYDLDIDRALNNKNSIFSYVVINVHKFKLLPRPIALILFWLKAQYPLFFGNINIAIISPAMMLIIPKQLSIISIAHHYDPTVFRGLKRLYVKLYHWFFLFQRNKVNLVVSCSEYWSNFYREKGFKNAITIHNGFDIESMDRSLNQNNCDLVLKKYKLDKYKYLHLGKYAIGKGQSSVLKSLKKFGLTMIATGSSKTLSSEKLNELRLINANYDDYNIILKHAKAVICMSEFKEGWCRVLHEAAIHGTPILGSGLGGMGELLNIGNLKSSTIETLGNDLNSIVNEKQLSNDKVRLYRLFNLEKFNQNWLNCVNDLLNAKN